MTTEAHDCVGNDALAKAQAAQSAAAGLAREVESMKRAMKLTATTGDVARLGQELSRLAQLVTELGDALAEQAATLANAQAGKGTQEVGPSWLCAPLVRDTVKALLNDLTSWMDGIYVRYADAARTLTECWMWHPEVVEELLWLMYAWLAAYQGDEASVKAAGDWHDRLRPGVVRRIGDYTKGCSLENHLPHRAQPPAEVPLCGAADAITAWWSDNRRDPAPEPTKEQLDEALAASNRARPGGDTR